MSGREPGLGDLLDQDVYWCPRDPDGSLGYVLLEDMTSSHLANLRAWLIRNAGKAHSAALSSLYGMSSLIGGEQASYDLDIAIGSLEEQDPAEWMEEQPLLTRITTLLADRLEETHGG